MENKIKLILGSQSPRRKELLKASFLKYDILVSEIDEISDKISPQDIAQDIALAIDALSTEFTVTSVTDGVNAYKQFIVQRNVSGTATPDLSPLAAALPSLNFVIDAAMTSTTAVLGNAGVAGFQTASHLSNTFASSRISLPNVTPVAQTGLRITLRATNGLAMADAVTMTTVGASNTAIDMTGATSLANTGADFIPFLLVDGVDIPSSSSDLSSGTTDATAPSYYVATGFAVGTENVQTAGVTAVTTDRTGWL